jgi:hypothetical protein
MSGVKTQESERSHVLDLWEIIDQVPWDAKEWETRIDALLRAQPVDNEWTLWNLVFRVCTVEWGPDYSGSSNRVHPGIPQEALQLVLDKIAKHCRTTRHELCKGMFRSSAILDISDYSQFGGLSSEAVENCVRIEHLQWLYEEAKRPAVTHAFVARLAMTEIGILKYKCEIGSEHDGDVPLDKVREALVDRDTIDKMVTVKTFGLERVTEALQAVYQSEDPWAEPEED